MSEADQAQPDAIEVGCTDGTLRFWLAKEALRQVEGRLKQQAEVLGGMHVRATALLGWTVTGLLALVAAFALPRLVAPAGIAAVCLSATALSCLRVLWPRDWSNQTWDPGWIMSTPLGSELEVVEAMVQGGAEAIARDERRLRRAGTFLRAAYAALVLAPVLGLLVLAATSSATPPSFRP